MAAFYYVKNGGTATGDEGRYASQQTGSFANAMSNDWGGKGFGSAAAYYYNNIELAIAATTPPVAGDFINVSDLHSFSTASNITYTGVVVAPYFVVCVDDANVDAGRTSGNRGVENSTGGTSDVTWNNQYMSGLEFSSVDDGLVTGANILSDCKILSDDSAADIIIRMLSDGASLFLENCEIALNNAGSDINIQNGCSFEMYGGSVTTTSVGLDAFILGGFISGGGHVDVFGVDLTAVTGTLLAGVGSDAAVDDIIDVRFDMCKLASGVAFTNETFKSKDQRALFTRCSDTSSAAEYQYHLHTFGGDVDDDSTIRRGDDPAFEDSGTDISYKIVTNSDAGLGAPLWFDFPNPRWSPLSSTATDTLRFYVASTSALTDKDVYIVITYPDGTNKQTPNFFSSGPINFGGTIDLMASGTTLTTDSGSDWRDGAGALAGHNEYQIDVTTTGDVGADTVANVRVYITKPSVTIQLASIYDLN